MTEDKKIEIFYDHYKDTFENQKRYLDKRNLYTLICLGLISLSLFQISSPDQTKNISDELIKEKIGKILIDFNYVNNVLNFSLLWISMMYFQINLIIDKYYEYLQEIELSLSSKLTPFEISREGKKYFDNYPTLLNVVHYIYTIIFPLSLIIIAIIKWISEIQLFVGNLKNVHFIFDTIFLLLVVITTILYSVKIHFNDFKKNAK